MHCFFKFLLKFNTMNSKLLLTYIVIIVQFVLVQGVEKEVPIVLAQGAKEEALVFDRFSRSLFQLPGKIPKNAICDAWALACPAESSAEKAFIDEYSFSKNALFVKKIYDRRSNAAEVRKNQCKDSFRISLTYNVKSLTFQFGYEIYYELTDAAYFHTHKFEDYKSPGEVTKAMTTFLNKAKFLIWKEYFRVLQNAFDSGIRELWIDRNKRMGFTWIYLTKFTFDFSKKIVKRMMYYIGPNSRWPVLNEQCEDFSLGSEFYEDVGLDELYAQDDVYKFFNFKKPESITCDTNVQCFHKWLLIPMDQFRFGSSASPVCSNMVTVPIWKMGGISFSLKRVDQFLYALYRHIGEPLHIIAGVSGKSEFRVLGSLGRATMYLNLFSKEIPIPKLVYKMVEYRVKKCKLDEESCWYSVIVVVHNDPLFKSSDRLCAAEFTKKWGWEGIAKDAEGKEQDFVYVCPRTKYIIKKLIGFTLRRIAPINAELKLTEFPFSEDGILIQKTDITELVNRKLEEFVKNGENIDHEAEKIMELAPKKINPASKEFLVEEEAQTTTPFAENDTLSANYKGSREEE